MRQKLMMMLICSIAFAPYESKAQIELPMEVIQAHLCNPKDNPIDQLHPNEEWAAIPDGMYLWTDMDPALPRNRTYTMNTEDGPKAGCFLAPSGTGRDYARDIHTKNPTRICKCSNRSVHHAWVVPKKEGYQQVASTGQNGGVWLKVENNNINYNQNGGAAAIPNATTTTRQVVIADPGQQYYSSPCGPVPCNNARSTTQVVHNNVYTTPSYTNPVQIIQQQPVVYQQPQVIQQPVVYQQPVQYQQPVVQTYTQPAPQVQYVQQPQVQTEYVYMDNGPTGWQKLGGFVNTMANVTTAVYSGLNYHKPKNHSHNNYTPPSQQPWDGPNGRTASTRWDNQNGRF